MNKNFNLVGAAWPADCQLGLSFVLNVLHNGSSILHYIYIPPYVCVHYSFPPRALLLPYIFRYTSVCVTIYISMFELDLDQLDHFSIKLELTFTMKPENG